MRRRSHVLVAEDDDDMRSVIVDALARDGHSVGEARNGGQLLQHILDAFAAGAPRLDLIVTDIRMPILSGMDVLQALREAHRMIPVIVITAFADDDARMRAVELDALLLSKPLSMDDLRIAAKILLT